jgi:hypothetical protein
MDWGRPDLFLLSKQFGQAKGPQHQAVAAALSRRSNQPAGQPAPDATGTGFDRAASTWAGVDSAT